MVHEQTREIQTLRATATVNEQNLHRGQPLRCINKHYRKQTLIHRNNCVGKVLASSYIVQCSFSSHEDILWCIHEVVICLSICGKCHMAKDTLPTLKKLVPACFMAVSQTTGCPNCHSVGIIHRSIRGGRFHCYIPHTATPSSLCCNGGTYPAHCNPDVHWPHNRVWYSTVVVVTQLSL